MRLLTFVLAVVLVAACAGGPGASGSPTSGGGRAGEPAPALAGRTLDGATFDLASLRGRPIVVNFWASWCIPCRDEFPLFRDALASHGADGLTFVGVVFKDDDNAARAFLTKMGAAWPSLSDPDGGHARDWGVVAPPQTYFIGRDGVVRSRQIGELTRDDLARQLDLILR